MTKLKIAVVFAGLILMAVSASAQTKVSGAFQCGKPDPMNALPIGDRPGHAYVTMKDKCTWIKPLELAGIHAKTAEDVISLESSGAKSRDAGYHTTTMDNGDQFLVKFNGSSMMDKNGAVQSQAGTWSFVSGTGKLKGIVGKGTYKAKAGADGIVTTEVEGDYQIAAVK